MNLSNPPFATAVNNGGVLFSGWAAWVRDLFRVNAYPVCAFEAWTPTVTGLTVTGPAPTLTGQYSRNRNTVHFEIILTPGSGGTVAAVSGTSYVTTLPALGIPPKKTDGSRNVLPAAAYGDCRAYLISTMAHLGNGFVKPGETRVYLPTFAAQSSALAIVGQYIVGG